MIPKLPLAHQFLPFRLVYLTVKPYRGVSKTKWGNQFES